MKYLLQYGKSNEPKYILIEPNRILLSIIISIFYIY